MTITELAPAKINLALHIRRKRPDGYHDLETLFAFARDGDVLRVTSSDADSFRVVGPFARALTDSDTNLVLAAKLAFERGIAPLPFMAIELEKNLPIASGIGGGSADAAAALRVFADLSVIPRDSAGLLAIAASLGADVPACLLGRTAFATGRGDDLTPLPPLGDQPLLLVNPLVPLSTAAMFAAWDGLDAGPIPREGDPLANALHTGNSFTAPAIAAAPVVGEVLDLLAAAPGATFSRLSGSGATCFALFVDILARDMAAEQARALGWWALGTRVV